MTISVKGTTLSLVLDSSVNDITDRGQVKDTGLVDLATTLISKGNTIQISFEDGQSLKLTASNVATMLLCWPITWAPCLWVRAKPAR